MTEESPIEPAPEEWAIIEIMGHLRTAGRITEEDRFGAKLLRVDRPYSVTDGDVIWSTAYYTGSAIYQLRLCDEITAKITSQSLGDPRPRSPTYTPPALTSYRADEGPGLFDDDDDDRPF